MHPYLVSAHRLATLLLCATLAACATAPPASLPPVFNDRAFAPAIPIDAGQVFALSESMRQYLQTDVSRAARNGNPRVALYDALYDKRQLKLEYDASMTRNARETFDARSGNCLSLVIMTAALAHEMNLQVRYQEVLGEENWSRSGDMYFVAGHVNIVLGPRMDDNPGNYDARGMLVIDFLPSSEVAGYRTHDISEATILAMYMNNRAAETMSAGQLQQAYWWARAAIVQDPGFSGAYNTLGVIQLRHGDLAEARQTLTYGLTRMPDNTVLLANLAQLLETSGLLEQARPLRQRLLALQPEPPFHYFNLGRAAMERGDYAQAVGLFTKEIARDPYYHEFHFWLAQAYARLGQLPQAGQQLTLAMDNSLTHNEHSLYAAKLQRLHALSPP
ncbi:MULTISPECIES: tetratricopeptide repeat protein [unclassified Janthinobacterium]|uniref:tetratricopeptide repeat protein n=1 Tax=unclassified Janthinobacterium TaxID=2610881 RepID=UPI00160DF1EA|nr:MULTISPECIES: tetratricopeptide repeat protein [unclassified Janthinobacterium]MBB5608665.1 Flp pilus assembly protein TadD [Janthinobacterium sp. S3T4]MBB5613932.1 Flp pilus assembly protein TadD [Janthinobacterium sp. S3M3]